MTSSIDEYNHYRISNGSPPLAPPNKYKRPRSLRMTDKGWDGLRDLAQSLGYTFGGQGNVTALLEAIGYNMWDLSVKVKESASEPIPER